MTEQSTKQQRIEANAQRLAGIRKIFQGAVEDKGFLLAQLDEAGMQLRFDAHQHEDEVEELQQRSERLEALVGDLARVVKTELVSVYEVHHLGYSVLHDLMDRAAQELEGSKV